MKNTKKFLLVIMCVILTVSIIGVISAFAADETTTPGSKGEIQVWLIAGQSNAVGYSNDMPDDATADSRYADGFENVLYYGYHEGNIMQDFVQVTAQCVPKSTPTSGAELGIASVLANSDTMNAVIKCATGSTKLYPESYRTGATDQRKTWTSPSYISDKGIIDDEYIGNMYTDFIATVTNGIQLLIDDGYTPVIKGMLWAQGEGETNDVEVDGTVKVTAATMTEAYAELLAYLVNDVRRDLASITGDASLSGAHPMPFGMVKITKNPTSSSYEESIPYVANINAAQEAFSSSDKNAFVIDPAEAFGFGQHDAWHFNANTQKHIGEQFVAGAVADKYLVTADGAHVRIDGGLKTEGEIVTVRFTAEKGHEIHEVVKYVNGESEKITLKGNNTYTFTMPAAEVRFVITVKASITPYGVIPANYSDSLAYPWVVFDKDKNFVTATDDFTVEAASAASAAGDGAVILLTRDLNNYDEKDAYGGSSLSRVNGSITVDLGGHVMNMGAEHGADAFIRMEPCIAGATTTVTVKNGTIIGSESDPIVRFASITDRIPYEKTYDETTKKYTVTVTEETLHRLYVNLEGIDIIQADAESKYLILLTGNSSNIANEVDGDNKLTISNCDITMKDSASDKYFLGSSGNFDVDVEFVGGSLEVNSIVTAKFSSVGSGTTVKMSKGADGNYMTLKMPKTADVIPTQTFTSDLGETVKYLFSKHEGENNEYTVYELSGEDMNATKYGNYKNSYAWEVFSADGTFLVGGTNFTTTVAKATVDGCFVYLVKDASFEGSTMGSGENNLSNDEKATIIVDLGGHTLTTAACGKADAFIRCEAYRPGYETNIVVKNGKIMVGSDPLVRFTLHTRAMDSTGTVMTTAAEYTEAYANNPHKLKVTLEDLDIETTSITKNLFVYTGASDLYKDKTVLDATNWDNTLVIKDCNVTIADVTVANYMFVSNEYFPVKVEVLGGTFYAQKEWPMDKIASIGATQKGAYMKFGPGSDGEYTKYVSYGTAADDGTVTYTTVPGNAYADLNDSTITDLKFREYSKDETNLTVTYIMSSLVTPYGNISSKRESLLSYPWVVFKGDGTFVGGGGNFTTTIADALAAEADGDFYIYLRRNYSMEEFNNGAGYTRFGKLNGSVVIDLNGYTVTMGSGGIKNTDAFLKLEPYANGYITNITVKNGEFELGADPLVGFAAVSGSSRTPEAYYAIGENGIRNDITNPQTFNVLFTDVVINAGEDATEDAGLGIAYSSLDATANANVKFTNCDFNITTSKAIRFGRSTGNSGKTQILPQYVIEGGTINANNSANLKWTEFSTTSDSGKESLTFAKLDGKYPVVTLIDGTNAPANIIIGKDVYTFVKASVTDGKTIFALQPKELANFKVKTSVTLYSDFVYNVYIPAFEELTAFTLNGISYTKEDMKALKTTVVDGVTYYMLCTNVAPAEAADSIVLAATLTYADDYNGKWTLNVLNYAKSVIDSPEYDSVTKTLMEDVLSYTKAAYVYFNGVSDSIVSNEDLANAKAAIESVIGADYDAANAPIMSETGVKHTGAELSDVTISVGDKLSFIFSVSDGYDANDFVFTMGGAKLEKIVEGNTITVRTYAYAVRNEIEYTVNGTDISGSYNLKSYYDVSDANVKTLLERLWKYSESAEAYKLSVTD